MGHMSTFALILLLVGAALSAKVRYDNYKVYRVIPENRLQLNALKKLELKYEWLDFWKSGNAVGTPFDIMVSPDNVTMFLRFMRKVKIQPKVYIENVQSLIDEEALIAQETLRSEGPRQLEWTSYHSYDEITSWLEEVAQQNPDIASTFSLGTSYEGRDLRGIKLSTGGTNKPAIFVDGGHHAREWITGASVTWFINELVTSTDPEVKALVDDFDWYIEPVMNPDGYEYTRSDSRLWRKTRSESATSNCYGADPNRNYGYQWLTGGSSTNPCSDTYAGSSAFSEVETQAIADFADTIADRLVLYLSFHSYGQYILIPYGQSNEVNDFYEEHMRIGNIAADAISQKHGTKYTVGNVVDILYVATGESMDYFQGVVGTETTFTIELRDTGSNGFVLPPNQIIPTAEETFDGVRAIVAEVQNKIAKKSRHV